MWEFLRRIVKQKQVGRYQLCMAGPVAQWITRLWLAIPAITMVLLRILKYVTRYVCEVTRYVIHVTRNLNYVTRFLS